MRPDLPGPLADDRVEHSWASYSQTLSNLVLAAEASRWPPETSEPVRILAGSDDDGLDHQYLAELADRHDLPLAAPEQCLAAIRNTLADVGARR